MAVQVQSPQTKRRDALDLILGGLQAASAFTNIQKGQAEIAAIPEAKARIKVDKERELKTKAFDKETKLRSEWLKNKQTQTTQDVAAAAGKVAAVATGKPSAAGDVSLVFSYMKLLDPGSVVREGEQALARNAAGVPERLRTLYNNIRAGESLSPNQRADFAGRAVDLYDVHWKQQQSFNKQFRELATRNELVPENVVLNLGLDPTEFKQVINSYLEKTKEIGGFSNTLIPKGAKLPKPTSDEPFDIDSYLIGD